MKRILITVSLLSLAAGIAALIYGVKGWYDAGQDASAHKKEAAGFVSKGLGADRLPPDYLKLLLAIEDPTFNTNNGTDFSSPGAGLTTITQSLSKRLAFENFKPGIGKIRQTGYAIGLTRNLSKDEILTLFLNKAPFGSSKGQWFAGFDTASRNFFGAPVADIERKQFTLLVASGIAPGRLHPDQPNQQLIERVKRINRFLADQCKPHGHGDVWLQGCASVTR